MKLFPIFVAILFFLLTPGVVLCLPPGGDRYTVALVHTVIFTVLFSILHNPMMSYYYDDIKKY
jgi:hypothetical protein